MSKITIQKYVSGTLGQCLYVPATLVKMAVVVLPESAIRELKNNGIDIPAMLHALKTGQAYASTMEVIEDGVAKTVSIALEATSSS
ncbi:hypothetical protein E9531_04415 [Lampropedia puyangensis]|uniref:Uncharacterized protein n=1 Tax=Lampropedia puyangensis TaxID=1330072 RepID=A0A4S8FAC6_9BURK|nr:hypothetical protein [Lampropedia puyangensis]THU03981.1 hypothetical protein E9531_04415 [Lampropedia puyangensis]